MVFPVPGKKKKQQRPADSAQPAHNVFVAKKHVSI
jgi:hypothetical protein